MLGSIAIGCIALCTSACHLNVPRWTSRYVGTAAAVGATGHWASAIPLDIRLVDCPGNVSLELGKTCTLHGSWALADYDLDDQNRAFHRGTFVIDAGQPCSIALDEDKPGTTDFRISNGVLKIDSSRIMELTLAGVFASGQAAGRHATFTFTAPPDGLLTDAHCRP